MRQSCASVQAVAWLWLCIAGLYGASAVALGAYAAHGMAEQPAAILELMEKATRYQMFHAVALVAVAAASFIPQASRWFSVAGGLFSIGTVFFCGALYAIALGGWAAGPLAPYGGMSLIGGWLAVAIAGWRTRCAMKSEAKISRS